MVNFLYEKSSKLFIFGLRDTHAFQKLNIKLLSLSHAQRAMPAHGGLTGSAIANELILGKLFLTLFWNDQIEQLNFSTSPAAGSAQLGSSFWSASAYPQTSIFSSKKSGCLPEVSGSVSARLPFAAPLWLPKREKPENTQTWPSSTEMAKQIYLLILDISDIFLYLKKKKNQTPKKGIKARTD